LDGFVPTEGHTAERSQMQNIVGLKFVNNMFNTILRQQIHIFKTDFHIFIMIDIEIGAKDINAFYHARFLMIFQIFNKMPRDKAGKAGDQVFIHCQPLTTALAILIFFHEVYY
jgi:hypothetical protein